MCSLKLYASALKLGSNISVLAFVESVLDGTVETLYYGIPSSEFSVMRGRPCKTRDLSQICESSFRREPSQRMGKHPALLLSTPEGIVLQVAGKTLHRLKNLEGLVVAIPTSSNLEQFAIVCNPVTGKTTLLSTTRLDLQIQGSFELEIPEGETKIDWIDVLPWYNNEVVLYWGGTDPLRGQTTWQYFTGMNLAEINDLDEFFVATTVDDQACEALRERCAMEGYSDFTQHGSVLTSWTQLIDREANGCRIWSPQCKLAMGQWSLADMDENCLVWGAPNQYFTINCKSWCCSVLECGETLFTFTVPECYSFCVLYSHCSKRK